MKSYTKEQVESILSKTQQAILCNMKDAAMNDNYAVEYFTAEYGHPYEEGEWLVVVCAETGAIGANGAIGKVTCKRGEHGLEGYHGDRGLRLRIGSAIWNIGRDYKVRLATKEEINLITATTAASNVTV